MYRHVMQLEIFSAVRPSRVEINIFPVKKTLSPPPPHPADWMVAPLWSLKLDDVYIYMRPSSQLTQNILFNIYRMLDQRGSRWDDVV